MKKIALFSFFLLISGMVYFFLDSNQIEQDDLIELINQEMQMAPSASGQTFDLLDATHFTDLMYPWLGYPVTLIREQDLFAGAIDMDQPLDEQAIRLVLEKKQLPKRIIFDFPSLRAGWGLADSDLLIKQKEWMLKLIGISRKLIPEADIGVLGIPISPMPALGSKNLLSSYNQSSQLFKPVIESVDTVYPVFDIYGLPDSDLYFFLGSYMFISKSTNKPVYPIVSHRNMQPGSSTLLPIEQIRMQCEFIRKHADGMVWWSPDEENWNGEWYQGVRQSCFI